MLEGLFGAFGLDAEKEKVREQAAREEKLYRMKLFEPDLKIAQRSDRPADAARVDERSVLLSPNAIDRRAPRGPRLEALALRRR